MRHPPILSTHATHPQPPLERERLALCSSFIQNITTHHTVHEAKLHPPSDPRTEDGKFPKLLVSLPTTEKLNLRAKMLLFSFTNTPPADTSRISFFFWGKTHRRNRSPLSPGSQGHARSSVAVFLRNI